MSYVDHLYKEEIFSRFREIPIYLLDELYVKFEDVTPEKLETKALNALKQEGTMQQIYGIAGPSGEGKSSLLNYLMRELSENKVFAFKTDVFLTEKPLMNASELLKYLLKQLHTHTKEYAELPKRFQNQAPKLLSSQVKMNTSKKMSIGGEFKGWIRAIPGIVKLEAGIAGDIEKFTSMETTENTYSGDIVQHMRDLGNFITTNGHYNAVTIMIDETDKIAGGSSDDVKQFFQSVLPILAKTNLNYIIVLNEKHLADPNLQDIRTSSFSRLFRMPRLTPKGIDQILTKRIRTVLERNATLDEVFESDALEELHNIYFNDEIANYRNIRTLLGLCRDAVEKAHHASSGVVKKEHVKSARGEL